MTRRDEIYVGGYQGHDQLEPADSLAGELGEDPLDAGYSPPDREPPGLRIGITEAEQWRGESLEQRLAEEEPDSLEPRAEEGELEFDRRAVQRRAGRLVAPGEGASSDQEPAEIASDVGRAGWAASAEEAAIYILDEDDDEDWDDDWDGDWGEQEAREPVG